MQKTIYIFTHGTLKREGNTIYINDNPIPVETVDSIMVFSEVTLNKRFLEFLTKKNIPIHFFNRYGYYQGTYYPRDYLNSGYIIVKQVEHFLNPNLRLNLAKSFVIGSILNMSFVLRTYASRGKDVRKQVDEISSLLKEIERIQSIPQLMALEGRARETYYSAFDAITENPEFSFGSRTKRPPGNRMNALISFGNSQLYVRVLSEIYRTLLDPRIGYLHEPNRRAFSLNLDIAEVFKPIIVDRVIFQLINRREITSNDFLEELDGIYLKERGIKRFLKAFEDRLKETIYHKKMKKKVSYKNLIRLECYKLYKHFIGDEEYKPFIRTR